MPDRPTAIRTTAPPDIDAYLARFAWHPEPELVGYRDETASRDALARLGADTWAAALDFLYEHALDRAMGDPAPYAEIRAALLRRRRRAPAAGPGRPDPLAATSSPSSEPASPAGR